MYFWYAKKSTLYVMKKNLFLFLIGLFLSLLFVGCEKDIEGPSVKVSPENLTIDYNESASITLTVKNGLLINSDLPGFNNIQISDQIKSFELETPQLINSVTYNFVVFGENEMISNASVTITVKDAPKLPKCEITATPTQIQYSGTALINISVTDAYSLVTDLPGVQGVSGVFQTPVLSETIWYRFTFIGPGGTTKDSIQIVVIQPSLHVQMLTANSLRAVSSRESYVSAEGPWTITPIDYTTPCMMDNVYTFSLNGKAIFSQGLLCAGGTVDPVEFDWSLEGDSLNRGGYVVLVSYWGFDKIVCVEPSSANYWDGTQWIAVNCWMEVTYCYCPVN